MPKGQELWDTELCHSVTLRMGVRVNHALHFPASDSSDGVGGRTAWGAVSWLAAVLKRRPWHFSLQGSPESEDVQR